LAVETRAETEEESSGLSEDPSGSESAELPSPSASDSATSFDIEVWANERQIVANVDADRCAPARLGETDDTLWCFRHEDHPGGRVLFFQALYAAKNKRLNKVLELPIGAGIVPLEERGGEPSYIVKLDTELEEGAVGVRLTERRDLDCETARKKNADAYEDRPEAGPVFRKLIDKVCAARGRYRYSAGRLRRVD
jgi:hypothetical protein